MRAASPPAHTLLELGAGAGNNAFYMKRRFRCTLADLSPEMSALSRAQNPECAHVLGDMRTLRLGATFDAVFVHDAVNYITSEDERGASGTRVHECGLRDRAEIALVLREDGKARVHYEQHVEGLFPRATWMRTLEGLGSEIFLARRP